MFTFHGIFNKEQKYLTAFYAMRHDTNWRNYISYESARYSYVMKKCGFHRCHLT